MQFSSEELQSRWNELIRLVNDNIASPRKEQLIALYEKFQERILFAPASSIEHFHNAFPGGYIDHIIRVVNNSMALYSVWKAAGARVDNFTMEELVFSALNHDLGKIGDVEHEQYVPNKSDWHRNNLGKIYAINPEIDNMDITTRTLFMLQLHGIPVSKNEYIAIYVTDGLYEDKNKSYLVTWDKEKQLKFNLPIILHHADMLSLHVERDMWRQEREEITNVISKINPQTAPKKVKSNPQVRNEKLKEVFTSADTHSTNGSKIFDELFRKE